jgi:ferredoxin-nitrite reductase
VSENVNKLERLKAEMPPADFLPFLSSVDWEHVDERERFYLKNYGIYNIKMRPEVYMLRLRIDGGEIAPERLERIARLAQRYGAQILLTARAQIELHGIAPSDVYDLYRQLRDAGITTHQSLTDNFRAITTDPYDGVAHDSRIACLPLIAQIRDRILDRPEWIGTLPRKFNTALIGRRTPLVNPWANDLLFALARKGDRWGFNVYLGGKNSETAQRADIFVLPERVPDLFMAVARTFVAHGLRGSRAKIRLFHLIEHVGIAQVRTWIEEAFGARLDREGVLEMGRSHYTPHTPLQGGAMGHILFTEHGEITAQEAIAHAVRAHESGGALRIGTDQNLHRIGSEAPPSPERPVVQITACAGIRYCPLALWDIKREGGFLPLARLERHGITVGFSGCLKGCGRHYHSDIGLFGLRTNLYGETERAVRVYLGATEAPDPAPGRMIYYSVPERAMGALIDAILDDYEASGQGDFKAYARHIRRYSIEWIQLWYLLRLTGAMNEEIKGAFERGMDEEALAKQVSEVLGAPLGEGYADAIRDLSHRVWDQ